MADEQVKNCGATILFKVFLVLHLENQIKINVDKDILIV